VAIPRLEHIPGFDIDRVADTAGDDREVARLENLDTDLPPPRAAVDVPIGDLAAAFALFGNEPVHRLAELMERVRTALALAALRA